MILYLRLKHTFMTKIKNYVSVLCILSAIIISGCDHSIKDQEKDIAVEEKITTRPPGLPPQVMGYLAQHLPEWKIPDTSDYAKSWWSFHDKKMVPYSVVLDFNDDEIADYVLLVHNDSTVKLLLLLGNKETFNHFWATDFKQPFLKGELQYGVAIQPPGRIDIAFPEIRSLILKSNAINLLELENRLAMYYFKDQKLSVFTTK
jgi:hypothetical protein